MVIDSSEFVDSLDLQPSEKKLLHFPCDNYSLWLNYCAKFPALCIPQSQKRQQFKYFPFSNILRVLIHHSEFVHYQHATGVWSEELYNERVLGAIQRYRVKPDLSRYLALESSWGDAYKDLCLTQQGSIKSIAVSTRSVSSELDDRRNTSVSSLRSILQSCLNANITSVFFFGQSLSPPSVQLVSSFSSSIRFHFCTHSDYFVPSDSQDTHFRIQKENAVFSAVDHYCLPQNGLPVIPRVCGGRVLLYDTTFSLLTVLKILLFPIRLHV